MPAKVSRRKKKLALVLAGLAAALLTAEVGIRFFLIDDEGLFLGRPLPPFGALNHPRQVYWLAQQFESLKRGQEPRTVSVFDVELGWTNRPGSTSSDGAEHVNSAGARGKREYAAAVPEGITRLLCVGDSFTYCSEVADEGTWQSQLERLHAEREVLNFGVPSYGTDQALLRFRQIAPHWGFDVACMGLLFENIGRNVNRYRPLYYPSTGSPSVKPRFTLEGEELRLLPQPFATRAEMVAAVADGSVVPRLSEHEYWGDAVDLGAARASALLRLAYAWRAYERRQPPRLWGDPDGEPYQVTLRILESFRDDVAALGGRRALVLVFPREQELIDLLAGRGDAWHGLLDELTRRQVPHIDLAAVLLEHYDAWRRDHTRPRTFTGGHLSPAANLLVAERLEAWLRQDP